MPRAPLRLCSGCRGRVPIGKPCPRCARAARKRSDARRGTAAVRGYGSAWARWRRRWLDRHPLCGDRLDGRSAEHSRCWAEGRLVPAAEVDHIRPVSGPDDPRFYDPAAVQSLCRACHSRKTATVDGAFGNERR